ncbi:MAG: AAA-like domain-containing protein, partial [Bacteroidota bacterium]
MATKFYYQAGGTLKKDFPGYVFRKADHDLLENLEAGRFCYVLTARQMGKSSLKVRCIKSLQDQGHNCVDIDITSIGSRNIDAERWYFSILEQIAEDLDIEDEFLDWWEENTLLTPVARMSAFWLDVVLPSVSGRIIIFLDEIDSLLSLDPNNFSTDDFFGAVRSLYNNRAKRPELERLNFCIIGVAIPDDLMADPSRTPFNIGTPINLENLSPSEAAPLEQGLEDKEAPASDILQEIMYWTNGQPYLTQRLCLEAAKIPIADPKKEVKALVDLLFLHPEKIDQDSNLANVRRRFLGIPEHAEQMILTYDRIVRGKKVPVDLRRREQ